MEGAWSYSCGVNNDLRFKWTAPLSFKGDRVLVESIFEKSDLGAYESRLPFKIFFSKAETDWLYVNSEGNFIPKLTYFDEIGPMETYPGGYPAFEKELNDLGVDWVSLRAKLKTDFIIIYQANSSLCIKK